MVRRGGKNEWLLAGRILKQGRHSLGKAGGFLEHAGTKDMQIPRSTGYGPAWVHDGQGWRPCVSAEMTLKDPENARFYERDGVAFLELGLGIRSEFGATHRLPLFSPSENPPDLPEEVAPLDP